MGMRNALMASADMVEPSGPLPVFRRLSDDDPGPALSSAFRVALLIPMCGTAGIWGPSCIASGQSTYEGLQFLASLMGDGRGDWRERAASLRAPIAYRSARQAVYASHSDHRTPIHLARADGMVFRIVSQIY